MAWYRRADYRRILDIMTDRDIFFPTFDTWESSAERNEAALRRKGIVVIRAYIDPEDFVIWCDLNQREADAKARAAWAAEVAKRQTSGTP